MVTRIVVENDVDKAPDFSSEATSLAELMGDPVEPIDPKDLPPVEWELITPERVRNVPKIVSA